MRNWYDWVFVAVLGLCWLIPCAQLFQYAFLPPPGGYSISAWYESPFWIEVRWRIPGVEYSGSSANIFSMNMLISFMAFIAALAMWFAARKITLK